MTACICHLLSRTSNLFFFQLIGTDANACCGNQAQSRGQHLSVQINYSTITQSHKRNSMISLEHQSEGILRRHCCGNVQRFLLIDGRTRHQQSRHKGLSWNISEYISSNTQVISHRNHCCCCCCRVLVLPHVSKPEIIVSTACQMNQWRDYAPNTCGD